MIVMIYHWWPPLFITCTPIFSLRKNICSVDGIFDVISMQIHESNSYFTCIYVEEQLLKTTLIVFCALLQEYPLPQAWL